MTARTAANDAPATAKAPSRGGVRPTITDVAQAAAVSLKTVSRVINDDPAVRPATREKVQQAIDALGWRPDPRARSLRGAHAHVLGLVYDNPNAHYVVSLQEGVLLACRERGFSLQILPCSAAAPRLADTLLHGVRDGRLAGLVLAPPMSEQAALVSALRKHGVPLVRIVSDAAPSLGRGGKAAADCLRVDDRRAARAITEHLVQLGHQRIGFLWGNADHGSSQQRHAGYRDALEAYGLPADRQLALAGDYSFGSGFRGARKLLALRVPPTAIFGSNDEIAAGVLAAARSAGLDVPWDLSIAGFEDSPFSRQAWPALTTARQSTSEIGRRAALLLVERVQHAQSGRGDAAAGEVLVPELVVRASTAPPQAAGRRSA